MEEEFEARLAHPRVSVVLVNKDGVDSLWHCLFALKTQTYQPEEVILADLSSRDASLSFVRSNYPKVKVLECPEDFSPALAANLGAKYAQGEVVALLSIETVPTPEWLARSVGDLRKAWPRAGALFSKLGGGTEAGPAQGTLNFLGNPVEGFFDEPEVVFHPEPGAILYARFLLPDGPCDEDQGTGQEGAYLGWKVRYLGREVHRISSAKVYRREEDPASTTASWNASYFGVRDRWLNLFFFYGTGTLIKVLPWVALEALCLLVKGLGSLRLLLGAVFAVLWITSHPRLVLQKRKELQARKKVEDGKVLCSLSGRLLRDGAFLSRPVNFISLLYCLAAGLKVMEFQE